MLVCALRWGKKELKKKGKVEEVEKGLFDAAVDERAFVDDGGGGQQKLAGLIGVRPSISLPSPRSSPLLTWMHATHRGLSILEPFPTAYQLAKGRALRDV